MKTYTMETNVTYGILSPNNKKKSQPGILIEQGDGDAEIQNTYGLAGCPNSGAYMRIPEHDLERFVGMLMTGEPRNIVVEDNNLSVSKLAKAVSETSGGDVIDSSLVPPVLALFKA